VSSLKGQCALNMPSAGLLSLPSAPLEIQRSGAAEDGFFRGAGHVDVTPNRPVDPVHLRGQFRHDGERRRRQFDVQLERQSGIDLRVLDGGLEIEWDVALDRERLDCCCRTVAAGGEFVVRVMQVEVEIGRIERGDGLGLELASLEFSNARAAEQRAASDRLVVMAPVAGEAWPKLLSSFRRSRLLALDIGRHALIEQEGLLWMIQIDRQQNVAGKDGECPCTKLMSFSRNLPSFTSRLPVKLSGRLTSPEVGGLAKPGP